jgi:DNA-directed RNA polymerase specialized sigma24 family protein
MTLIVATATEPEKNELLEQARAAAVSSEPMIMLKFLHSSGVLDGIARYIAAHWSDFDFADATLFVAAAVDRFYAKISGGENVRNISAFLFKVALNKASDEYERRKQHIAIDDAGEIAAPAGSPREAVMPREQLVLKALELARSFLPELGQENVQRVMAFDLEAVQKGVEDLPAKEVAEALGLNEDTVRQCRSRGWRRLRRVARKHNINLDAVLAEMNSNEEDDSNE